MADAPQPVVLNGKQITCDSCDGRGVKATWSFGVLEPDECKRCGGSGRNWQYPSGKIAAYYGGPFVG